MLELDLRVTEIRSDPQSREDFIREYKPFILKCASDCAKHYVTDSDDEWSIALSAFDEALDKFSRGEGHFLSFAKLVIRRRLYDYFDANQKFRSEVSVSPSVFSGEAEDEEECSEVLLQVKKGLVQEPEPSAVEEIQAANAIFAAYGFSFFELSAVSPKAEKTKAACARAAAYLLKNPILMNELHSSRQLPIKILEKNTGIPRKILERHRKYIIAAVELLWGDFPRLAEYLRPIREELNK
ncbi:MAG: RNA polymerase subunit sigma [Oscillospiraceae bacterium]